MFTVLLSAESLMHSTGVVTDTHTEVAFFFGNGSAIFDEGRDKAIMQHGRIFLFDGGLFIISV
jgi:hypothetical protein